MKKKLLAALFFSITFSICSGCGQTGALTLPEMETQAHA